MKTATLYIREKKFQFSSFEIDKTNKTDSIPDTSQHVNDTLRVMQKIQFLIESYYDLKLKSSYLWSYLSALLSLL